MKQNPLFLPVAALASIGFLTLATSCSKDVKSLNVPTLPVTTASFPTAPSIPLGTSTGTGYAVVWDAVISGTTTKVEVTEWGAYVTGERNAVEIAVENGYVMVGGGAQTVDPGGNPASVDAILTSAYPINDGTFSTYAANNKDHGGIFYTSDLYVYVIGIKLFGTSGAAIAPGVVIPHLTFQEAESAPADHPTYTIGVDPASNAGRILSGGAFIDYGTGYGNLLVEDDWANASSTASGKDQKEADVAPIYDFCLSIDNANITGFGTLNVQAFTGYTTVTNHQETLEIPVPSSWGITGVGGHSTYTGYGRLLYSMYAASPTQVIIQSKDQDVNDVSGTLTGIVSAVQPAQ